MPKDTLGDAFEKRLSEFSATLKDTKDLVKSNNDKIETFNSELKSEISSLTNEVTSLKDGLQQTIEAVVQDKLAEFSAAYDQELETVRKDIMMSKRTRQYAHT